MIGLRLRGPLFNLQKNAKYHILRINRGYVIGIFFVSLYTWFHISDICWNYCNNKVATFLKIFPFQFYNSKIIFNLYSHSYFVTFWVHTDRLYKNTQSEYQRILHAAQYNYHDLRVNKMGDINVLPLIGLFASDSKYSLRIKLIDNWLDWNIGTWKFERI